jgi:uncharacterized protein involved in exopolysaccharide biosynthesis
MGEELMDRRASDNVKYAASKTDEAIERCRQRLKEDLGLDDEAVEVVMKLLDQVTALQARLRVLESTVEVYQAGYSSRLTRYRQMHYEATWEELEKVIEE